MENQDINSLSEREQIKYIKKYHWKIQYINNPCLEVQLVAVNQNGYNIEYIKNPSLEVQLAAIQEETNSYKYHFEYIKPYITYPDLLELIELKILSCDK